MTNIATLVLILTNTVEFRTNFSDYTHPTNNLSIFKSDTKDLIPFLRLRETNIVRIDRMMYYRNGNWSTLEQSQTTVFRTQAVFELNPCKWTMERVP